MISPLFSFLVLHIILMSPQEQVFRVNTGGIVTSMKYMTTSGNLSFVYSIGHDVSPYHVTLIVEGPVAIR